MIQKRIKYQVSWYIFGSVSVSVSMIHFGCISIINHWYITVIHLLEFRTLYWQGLQLVDSSSWVSATVTESSVELRSTRILAMLFTDKSWSWRRFLWLRHNTINWCSNQCCWQGMYINHLRNIETELKMLARYSRILKDFIKFNTTLPSSVTSWKTVQHGWTDQSVTPQPSEWLTQCEKLLLLKQTTVSLELKASTD